MSDNDDALSRANKFLTVRRSTEVARIDNDAIAALLKEAEDSARPKEPARVEAKPQRQPVQEPVREAPRHAPPAVVAPSKPSVAVQSQTPGVTAEVLPPTTPAQGDGANPQNINVVVNVAAPAVPAYPWWWGYPYYPALCPACGGRPHHCMRWRCPY